MVDIQVLQPHVADPGYEVELHVESTPFETWQIAGTTPPPPETKAEKLRPEDNRSLPYTVSAPSDGSRLLT